MCSSVKATGLSWTALPLLLALSAAAAGQEAAVPAADPALAPIGEQVIEFSADTVTYDSRDEVITAIGRVRMQREGNYLAADQVTWTRQTGEVKAAGNVVVVTPEGDKLVSDSVVLTDSLRDGTIENLLVVLEMAMSGTSAPVMPSPSPPMLKTGNSGSVTPNS